MKRKSSVILGIASLAMGLLATAAFAGNYEQVVTSLAPTYWWHLDEAAGAPYAVEVGHASNPATMGYRFAPNNGSNNKKYDTAGIFGSAVLMNSVGTLGNNQLSTEADIFASAGTLTGFDPAQNVGNGSQGSGSGYTIQFWVKPTGHSAGDFSSSGANSYSFNYDFANSFQSYFDIHNPQDGVHRLTFTDGIVVGQWNLLTMEVIRTGATSVDMKFYTNGQLLPGASGSFTGLPTDFGVWNGLSFSGGVSAGDALDEITVFDYALSQNQILDEFNAVPEPGMLSLLALGGAFMVWRRKVAAKRA